MKNYSFGAVMSEKDSRDYKYSNVRALSPVLPSAFKLKTSIPRDQGKAGTCVGFAAAAVQECDRMLEGEQELLSPLYLYAKAKAIDGIKQEGTTLRDAMKVLTSSGICEEQLYPYVDNAETKALRFPTIAPKCDSNAAQKKIIGYASLNTLQDIKNAVYNDNGAILGVLVTDSFMDAEEGIVGVLNGTIKGYHAIAAYGWDDNVELTVKNSYGISTTYKGGLFFKNSWGAEWGRNGTGVIPYELVDIAVKEEAWRLKLVTEAWTTLTSETPTTDKDYHKKLNNSSTTIEIKQGEPFMTVNGNRVALRQEVVNLNGRLMVPLREPFEALGASVSWNNETKTAIIRR